MRGCNTICPGVAAAENYNVLAAGVYHFVNLASSLTAVFFG